MLWLDRGRSTRTVHDASSPPTRSDPGGRRGDAPPAAGTPVGLAAERPRVKSRGIIVEIAPPARRRRRRYRAPEPPRRAVLALCRSARDEMPRFAGCMRQSWSDAMAAARRPSRSMLNYGSPFHKVAGIVAVEAGVCSSDDRPRCRSIAASERRLDGQSTRRRLWRAAPVAARGACGPPPTSTSGWGGRGRAFSRAIPACRGRVISSFAMSSSSTRVVRLCAAARCSSGGTVHSDSQLVPCRVDGGGGHRISS